MNRYTKPALTFHEQAQRLISRGLLVDDPNELEHYLSRVNYYRLSGYWYIFKQTDPFTGAETFKPGTTFETIRRRYEFDRQLRLLLMAAIERIEVAIFRTQLVEHNALLYGPFGYTEQKNYNPKFPVNEFQKLLRDVADNEDRSHEEFIRRYRAKYSAEPYLPLWMAAELMSFGQLLTLYRNQHLAVKQTISHRYDLYPMVLDSWLLTLGALRNSCAHHSRIWNRPLPMPTRLPDRKYDPRWYSPHTVYEKSLYLALSFINHLLTYIAPADQWKQSVIGLLSAYPDIPLAPMGIPTDWQDSPLWS